MVRCMAICGACATVSVVAVVMEVYALMALQFCDGEDVRQIRAVYIPFQLSRELSGASCSRTSPDTP